MLVCKSCNIEKGANDFYLKDKITNRYDTVCKVCRIEGRVIIKSATHKICKHCGIEKEFSEFQKAGGGKWLQPYCKPCDSYRKKKHVIENATSYKEKKKMRYLLSREDILSKGKAERAEKRPDTLKRIRAFIDGRKMSTTERKERKSAGDRLYRIKNGDKIKQKKREYQQSGRATEAAKKWQKRQMGNVAFRLKKNLRGRVYVALKRGIKSDSTMNLLGCSIEAFVEYFKSLFKDGMTWERYINGEIHIDHIKPCIKFDLTDLEQQRACFHYTNLQPLWVIDNLKKGTKIWQIQ